MQIAILSARTGWHTDALCRALAERGHTGPVLHTKASWPDGTRRAALQIFRARARTLRCRRCAARIIPNGSLEQSSTA